MPYARHIIAQYAGNHPEGLTVGACGKSWKSYDGRREAGVVYNESQRERFEKKLTCKECQHIYYRNKGKAMAKLL